MSTTSAASIATSVPVPMAKPTSACASAGASLIPSPTKATCLLPSPCKAITASYSLLYSKLESYQVQIL